MSKVTKEINKISLAVISISTKLVVYVLLIVLLVAGAKKGYEFGHSIFYAPAMEAEPGSDKTIKLNGDESVFDVGEKLEKAGLIRDAKAFTIQAYCYEYEVKKGEYSLNTSLSSKEIINLLGEETEEESKS